MTESSTDDSSRLQGSVAININVYEVFVFVLKKEEVAEENTQCDKQDVSF